MTRRLLSGILRRMEQTREFPSEQIIGDSTDGMTDHDEPTHSTLHTHPTTAHPASTFQATSPTRNLSLHN